MADVTTFNYTGAAQLWTVPAGAGSILLECWGAQGQHYGGTGGGKGGYAKGTLIVTAGTQLQINVGGQVGRWPNGGRGKDGAGDGGGSSDVRMGAGFGLSTRQCVGGAGGGEGQAAPGTGGTGGGTVGGTGSNNGGTGGTQTSGNALSQGGDGQVGMDDYAGPGGGGGGHWGGKGATAGDHEGGGGGGSGYTGTLSSPLMTNGVQTGNGKVVITILNIAPLAPTQLTPTTGSTVFDSDACTVGWQFNDSIGDSQTLAQVRWQVAGSGSWTTITGAATTSPTYTFPAGTFPTGQIEWQAGLTADLAGLTSPWSASSFLTVIDALVAPTITSPASGASVFDTPALVEWTTPLPADAYQLQRTDSADGAGVIYYDSGQVTSTLAQAEVPLDPIAGRLDWLRVRYRFAGRWSPWASSSFDSQFGPPWRPQVVLTASSIPDAVGVDISITNPPAGSGFMAAVSNSVTRNGVLIATALPVDAFWTDLLPGAGSNTYICTAHAANGATAESY